MKLKKIFHEIFQVAKKFAGLLTPDLYGSVGCDGRRYEREAQRTKINWTKTAHSTHIHAYAYGLQLGPCVVTYAHAHTVMWLLAKHWTYGGFQLVVAE